MRSKSFTTQSKASCLSDIVYRGPRSIVWESLGSVLYWAQKKNNFFDIFDIYQLLQGNKGGDFDTS